MLTHTCTWCHKSFVDNISEDSYSRGSKLQEMVVDDVPWLCTTCNEVSKEKTELL